MRVERRGAALVSPLFTAPPLSCLSYCTRDTIFSGPEDWGPEDPGPGDPGTRTSLGTRLFAHGGRVWNTAHTRVVLRAPQTGCRISRCEPLCLHYVIIITHRNYNDVMCTLWFPPTYGPLARRTTRVWAVFQTLPPTSCSYNCRQLTCGWFQLKHMSRDDTLLIDRTMRHGGHSLVPSIDSKKPRLWQVRTDLSRSGLPG